jgi:hypothetical protein
MYNINKYYYTQNADAHFSANVMLRSIYKQVDQMAATDSRVMYA